MTVGKIGIRSICRLVKNIVPKVCSQIRAIEQNPVMTHHGFENKVTGRQTIDARPQAALERGEIQKEKGKKKKKNEKQIQDYHIQF